MRNRIKIFHNCTLFCDKLLLITWIDQNHAVDSELYAHLQWEVLLQDFVILAIYVSAIIIILFRKQWNESQKIWIYLFLFIWIYSALFQIILFLKSLFLKWRFFEVF